MRGALPYFIDTGAWIALAIQTDPYHIRAKERWEQLVADRGNSYTSIPIVIETFTFLDRNTDRKTAILWKEEVTKLSKLKIFECSHTDLENAWSWFNRKDLHKLSAVDAVSFTLMQRHKITRVFTFDTHFATAGFHIL